MHQYDDLVNSILNEGLGKNLGLTGALLGALATTGTPTHAQPITTRSAIQPGVSYEVPHHLKTNDTVDLAERLISKASKFIAEWEGFSPKSYPDGKDGKGRSIGYGFYLKNSDAPERVRKLGYNFKALYQGTQEIRKEDAIKLLNQDTAESYKVAKSFAHNFNSLPETAQLILIDMAYNLGETRLFGFENFRKAINKRDFYTAAKEMKNSKWFGQVGNRSAHHVNVMASIK